VYSHDRKGEIIVIVFVGNRVVLRSIIIVFFLSGLDRPNLFTKTKTKRSARARVFYFSPSPRCLSYETEVSVSFSENVWYFLLKNILIFLSCHTSHLALAHMSIKRKKLNYLIQAVPVYLFRLPVSKI